MSRSFCLIIGVSLGLIGCNQANSQDTQYDDSRNPHYKQAQQDLDNNKPADAAAEYEAALDANPKLVEAQYQLGILYGEKLQDPISSIYHFKRYLDLAPNSDHAANAKEAIDKESQAFAASQPNSSTQNADEVAKLQADNAALKKQADAAAATIAKLQAKLAQAAKHHHNAPVAEAPAAVPVAPADVDAPMAAAAATATAAATADASAPTNSAPPAPLRALPLGATNADVTAEAPAPAAGPSRSYTVAKGDVLETIAKKMYPHHFMEGEDKIRDANEEVFKKKYLQPGQVLVIPQ